MPAAKRIVAGAVGLLVVGFVAFAVSNYLQSSAPEGVPRAVTTAQAAQPPRPTWRPPVLERVPAGTVSHPALVVSTPQTYEIVADVLGYENEQTGVICLKLHEARLLAAVDAMSGKESETSPSDSGPDYAADLEGLTVLAGTTSPARDGFAPTCRLRVVLLPVGDGVTLYVDRVEGEVAQ